MEVEDLTHNLSQVSPKRIEVTEVENSSLDVIETTERILSMTVGFRHIICITTKEIQVFTKGNNLFSYTMTKYILRPNDMILLFRTNEYTSNDSTSRYKYKTGQTGKRSCLFQFVLNDNFHYRRQIVSWFLMD